jgi:protein-disulfide isomerase
MVEYFDYQCAACRTMAGHLAALIARHPEDLAVRLAPVPMDLGCNPQVPPGAHHRGSCAIAKTALAVWHHAPERFTDFHRKLLADPSPENARRATLEFMAADQLDALTGSGRVYDAIQSNIAGWRKLSLENTKLPKLLVRPGRILHGLPSDAESFIEVMESELGL